MCGIARDERLDSVKFWTMMLVIVGHAFMMTTCSSNPINRIVFEWIYLFHMPLFVFLSGFFTHTHKKKSGALLGLWKPLEPLLLFQTLYLCLIYFRCGNLTLETILTPWSVLWYLLCLLYWRIILYILPAKILNYKWLVILTSIIISLLAGFLPLGRVLSIQRALAFFPYFIIGYYMQEKNLFLEKKYKPLSFFVLLLTILIPIYLSDYVGLGVTMRASYYGNFNALIKRAFVFIVSIPMCVAFINVCPYNSWMARQGRFSLQYLIFHAILVVCILDCAMVMYHLPNSPLACVFYSLGTIGVLIAFMKLPFVVYLTNPSMLYYCRK